MVGNGNIFLDGLYLITKAGLNKRKQAKGYLLSIIGPITSSGGVSSYNDLTDVPLTFAPAVHEHVLADITDYVPGAGTGDMEAATYDPTSVVGDAFDYTNFTNTPTIPADLSDLTDTTGLIPTSVDDIGPSQTGNSGKYLTTDGTNASWVALVMVLMTTVSARTGPSMINLTDFITTSITIS